MHYVKFSKEWFAAQVADLRAGLGDELSPTLARELAEGELQYQALLLSDEEHYYLPVDGAIGWNSGVLGQINRCACCALPRTDCVLSLSLAPAR